MEKFDTEKSAKFLVLSENFRVHSNHCMANTRSNNSQGIISINLGGQVLSHLLTNYSPENISVSVLHCQSNDMVLHFVEQLKYFLPAVYGEVLQCMNKIIIFTHGLLKGRILQICYYIDCITQ
jgi:hypothetical protein